MMLATGASTFSQALNLSQALQLAALIPCIVAIVHVLATTEGAKKLIPTLYFATLSSLFWAGFFVFFPQLQQNLMVKGALLFLESLIPAFSFLFIMQSVSGKIPPPITWLVLAIPIIGGAPFIYLASTQDEVCLLLSGQQNTCFASSYGATLYSVFGAALMFLLLVFIISRKHFALLSLNDAKVRQQYWLVISLIAFNLLLLMLDITKVGGILSPENAGFTKTMIGITFVYLALSSLFRVAAPKIVKKTALSQADYQLAKKVTTLMERDRIYMEMGLNRQKLADRLGVSEHHLSRVMNGCLKQSFNELLNEYRIREAEKLLLTTTEPITIIAFDTGFSSITSFNRVFKQLTGLSATEYREQGRAQDTGKEGVKKTSEHARSLDTVRTNVVHIHKKRA